METIIELIRTNSIEEIDRHFVSYRLKNKSQEIAKDIYDWDYELFRRSLDKLNANDSISFSKAKIKRIDYRIRQQYRYYEAEIISYIQIKGLLYRLKLPKCLLTPEGWKLTTDVYFKPSMYTFLSTKEDKKLQQFSDQFINSITNNDPLGFKNCYIKEVDFYSLIKNEREVTSSDSIEYTKMKTWYTESFSNYIFKLQKAKIDMTATPPIRVEYTFEEKLETIVARAEILFEVDKITRRFKFNGLIWVNNEWVIASRFYLKI